MPLRRLCTTLTCLLLALGGALLATSPADAARPWPGHPDRHLVTYRVKAGDTAAGIATRFHAWTAELRRINGKGPSSPWYADELVRVPVVTSRVKSGDSAGASSSSHPKRTQVRRAVIAAAKRHGVPRDLALAVAWHESGWQQQVRSPVGAVGTMQVMPGNRVWLSQMAGERLRLRDLRDNATAGVVLLKILRTVYDGRQRPTLAAYYQGQGSLKADGLYEDTKQYVANVAAVKKRLNQGWRPDR